MSSNSTSKKPVIAFGVAILSIVILLVLFGDLENPKEISRERLNHLEQAVISFLDTNGRPPIDLSELALPEDQLKDHLGEPFVYKIDEHTITLLSYGSDKQPGGNFFKGDYSVTIELPKSK